MRAALILAVAVVACGGGGGEGTPKLVLRLTYAAADDTPGVAAAMQRRLDRLKIAGVARAAADDVIVELPTLGEAELAQAEGVIVRSGRFAVHPIDDAAAVAHLVAEDREEQVSAAEAVALGCLQRERCVISGEHVLRSQLDGLAVPVDRVYRFGANGRSWRAYLVERVPLLEASSVRAARAGGPGVIVTLSPEGTRALEAWSTAHVGRALAITIDDRVVNAPIVAEPIRSGTIQLAVDSDEAGDLAVILSTGPLPAPVLLQSSALID